MSAITVSLRLFKSFPAVASKRCSVVTARQEVCVHNSVRQPRRSGVAAHRAEDFWCLIISRLGGGSDLWPASLGKDTLPSHAEDQWTLMQLVLPSWCLLLESCHFSVTALWVCVHWRAWPQEVKCLEQVQLRPGHFLKKKTVGVQKTPPKQVIN